jgi:hypothetical protein
MKRGNSAGLVYQVIDKRRTLWWAASISMPHGKRKHCYTATQAEAQRL